MHINEPAFLMSRLVTKCDWAPKLQNNLPQDLGWNSSVTTFISLLKMNFYKHIFEFF